MICAATQEAQCCCVGEHSIINPQKKLNTRSSTDAEFVVLSEYLPYNLWVVMFVNDQVCLLKKNIIYQDIDIAIELHEKF